VTISQKLPPRIDGWPFALKHAVDRVIAFLGLLSLAPLLLVIFLGVYLGSSGPVIFRQRRVSRGGETFDLFKFRTMLEDADLASFTPVLGAAPGGIEGADRRTAFGRRLRASSLDELPQLFNVLRGEMSLIGPRPERPEYVQRFNREVPRYTERHRVKSGITGWAQANGLRGQTSIAGRVELDNYYIDNWSLGLELRTLALTVVELLRLRDEPADTFQDRSAQRTVGPPVRLVARDQVACAGRVRRLAPARVDNRLASYVGRHDDRGRSRCNPGCAAVHRIAGIDGSDRPTRGTAWAADTASMR
jgi:lipopolysaccharide/colanic/teichoic acid biosynthesis glycosyltransferase